MRTFSLLVLLCLLPCAGGAQEIRNSGMFVSSAGRSQSGGFEFFDSVVANGGGRVFNSEGLVEISLAEVFEFFEAKAARGVVGRFVFYNNSVWDGLDAAANADDDEAVAPDKEALRPGGQASFANYTSYDKGLNGIMVDFSTLADPENLSLADFEFGVWNTTDFSSPAPTPAEFALRRLANGNYRATIVFADEAIRNQWLKTRVLANGTTGLLRDDVFYFGNAFGSTGPDPSSAEVSVEDASRVKFAVDEGAVGDLGSRYDLDRNGEIDILDVAIAFNGITGIEWTTPTRAYMGSIAFYLGLSEYSLLFLEREALSLPVVEREPVDADLVKIDLLWLAVGELYVELDEEGWELVYVEDLQSGAWSLVEPGAFFEARGKGWRITRGAIPDTLFLRARLK